MPEVIVRVTPGEFARRLKEAGIYRSRQTITHWCRNGLPGAKKIGRVWEINEKTVQYVLDGNWAF